MPSLINSNLKAAIEEAMDNMHDTFARTIIAYKDSKRVIISTNEDYNYLYKNVNGSIEESIRHTIQFDTFKARILYADKQGQQMVDGDATASIKIERPVGEVRIKVDQIGYNYIKDAKRIEIDGALFYKNSDVRKHGLLSPRYYTYYLSPTDSLEDGE
jgi:hypothetical protein|tara:strand:+ start:3269 stop:3742 length:474 start_codon:yes stop_codon:yes gene_type:complete